MQPNTRRSRGGRRLKLIDNEFVTISIDPSVPCLEWTGKNYTSGAGETIEVKVFDDVKAAKDWLKA